MEITTVMIKELREKTGAGILDCKSALAEANGSLEEAEKTLRKKGLAAAAKKAGRVAAEGLVGYACDGSIAALVELNCETDFVAKTDDFRAARTALAAFVAAEASFGDAPEGNAEALKAMACPADARRRHRHDRRVAPGRHGEDGREHPAAPVRPARRWRGERSRALRPPRRQDRRRRRDEGVRRRARTGPRHAGRRHDAAVRRPRGGPRPRPSPMSARSPRPRPSPPASPRPSPRRWSRG